MNSNKILTSKFSNQQTEDEYGHKNANGKHITWQCLTCHYYHEFNADWGLCLHREGRIYLETIFEHFGCELHSTVNRKSSFLRPDRDELRDMLEHCECILAAIRPAYPSQGDKEFHLSLRYFLGKWRDAMQKSGENCSRSV